MIRSVFWLSAFLLASLLRLLLTDAGPALHFEHLRAAGMLGRSGLPALDAVGLLLCAALGLAVSWQLRSDLRAAASALWTRLGGVRCLIALGFLLATAAFPSRDLPAFGVELGLSVLLRLLAAALLWAALRALPQNVVDALQRRLAALIEPQPGATREGLGALAVGCALFSFSVSALLACFSYERAPHIPDEVAYLFQARYFATGALFAPIPPVKEAFETYLVSCQNGHCFSPFPPGWPAVLALGVLAHVPWLVNPLLGAANVLLVFAVSRRLYDAKLARLATLLFAVSPWHLLMSMSFTSHSFALGCALLATYCVLRTRDTQRSAYCLVGGGCIGLVSLSRPLEAAVVAVVLGFGALTARGRRIRFAPVVLLALGTLLVSAVNLPYNRALTGNATTFPVSKYMDDYWGHGRNDMGFGANRDITWNGLDPFPGHGLRDVIVNSQLCTSLIHTELFGWSTGSLWLVLALLLLGWARRTDLWLIFWVFAVVFSQAFYWWSGGPDFGARYWYTAIVPLTLLSARALLLLDERLAHAHLTRPFTLAAALLSLTALLLFVPWRAVDKYHHYRGLHPGLRELLGSHDLGRSLVLLRGAIHPDYDGATNHTPLDPYANGPVVYWDRDPNVERRLLAAYGDRPVWVVDGPSRAQGRYILVQGPLPPGSQPAP
ncbi:MAG TPA: glycosyltransferase family 39 protein [Polyangiales bacterium]